LLIIALFIVNQTDSFITFCKSVSNAYWLKLKDSIEIMPTFLFTFYRPIQYLLIVFQLIIIDWELFADFISMWIKHGCWLVVVKLLVFV